MDELLKILEEIREKLPENDVRNIKIDLIKSLMVASEDVSKLIKKGDLNGVEARIRLLQAEHTEIRSNFIVSQFAPGGFTIKTDNENQG